MRTLQIGDRPTKLAQAVAELGRIDKTIHALTYIDDEAERRRILFHGKQGELRQRYREGQEDQLSSATARDLPRPLEARPVMVALVPSRAGSASQASRRARTDRFRYSFS
jgi:hypothetical protein